MTHVDKKANIISIAGQSLILHNQDLLAMISRFLLWPEIASFVRCCKDWNAAFLSRPWGSPPLVRLKNNTSFNYVKYVKQVKAHVSEAVQLQLVSRLRPRKLMMEIIGDHNLSCLDHMKFSSLSLNSGVVLPEVMHGLNKFVAVHANRLDKLDVKWLLGSVAIPIMPKLKTLCASTINVMFENVYWSATPDPDFSNVMIDLRHIDRQCPRLSTFEILYHHDLIASIEALVANVRLLYHEIVKHPFNELIIDESQPIDPAIISPLFIWLPIFMTSKTLRKITVRMDHVFTDRDQYQFSKEMKECCCLITLKGLNRTKRTNRM